MTPAENVVILFEAPVNTVELPEYFFQVESIINFDYCMYRKGGEGKGERIFDKKECLSMGFDGFN
jgi:hypothetical protein